MALFWNDNFLNISIHALREEGDRRSEQIGDHPAAFLSTPSARRATAYHSVSFDV